jgi:hypothetical protein
LSHRVLFSSLSSFDSNCSDAFFFSRDTINAYSADHHFVHLIHNMKRLDDRVSSVFYGFAGVIVRIYEHFPRYLILDVHAPLLHLEALYEY